MSTNRNTFYAAFTEDSIVGIGLTEESAIEGAIAAGGEGFTGVNLEECTKTLFHHVLDFGGCGFAFGMVDGKLDILD